ncbi:MAG: hypothetical protein JXR78_12665 [Victivallales bacterium]|nr:hypothetical protein [Victivallales bacterium]
MAILALSVILIFGGFKYSEIVWGLTSNINQISKDNRNDLLYVKSSTNTIEAVCINIEAQISIKDKVLIEEIEKKMGKVKLHLENRIDDSKAFLNGKLNVVNCQLIQIETAHGFLYKVNQIEEMLNNNINLQSRFWTKKEVEKYWEIFVGDKHPFEHNFHWVDDRRREKYSKYLSRDVQYSAMTQVHPELVKKLSPKEARNRLAEFMAKESKNTEKIISENSKTVSREKNA